MRPLKEWAEGSAVKMLVTRGAGIVCSVWGSQGGGGAPWGKYIYDEGHVDEVLYRNIAARMHRTVRAELPGSGQRYGPFNVCSWRKPRHNSNIVYAVFIF